MRLHRPNTSLGLSISVHHLESVWRVLTQLLRRTRREERKCVCRWIEGGWRQRLHGEPFFSIAICSMTGEALPWSSLSLTAPVTLSAAHSALSWISRRLSQVAVSAEHCTSVGSSVHYQRLCPTPSNPRYIPPHCRASQLALCHCTSCTPHSALALHLPSSSHRT